MSKSDYRWITLDDFSGGIHLNPEEAAPNQVMDARNMWAPHGKVQQRPGYELGGISHSQSMNRTEYDLAEYINLLLVPGAPFNYGLVVKESAGVFTEEYVGLYTPGAGGSSSVIFDLASIAVDDKLYFTTNTGYRFNSIQCADLAASSRNTNNTEYFIEIYVNNQWVPVTNRTTKYTPYFFQYLYQRFSWDYTQENDVCTISYTSGASTLTVTDYWMRITLKAANPSVGSQFDYFQFFTEDPYLDIQGVSIDAWRKNLGVYFVDNENKKAFIFVNKYIDAKPYPGGGTYDFLHVGITDSLNNEFTNDILNGYNEASFTNIVYMPVTKVIYVLVNNKWFEFTDAFSGTTANANPAMVETDPLLVGTLPDGTLGDFNPEYVPQLIDWPEALYGEVFQGQIWAAGLKDSTSSLRWSAPQPAHKVWPDESLASLIEVDKSPITGMKSFGEQLAIFKRDSIWKVIYTGVGALSGLNTYNFVKIPGEIGTVSNKSIVDINATLFFMSEDGIYAYDGTNLPTKISDPIQDFINKISKGLLYKSCAVHWKSMHCYMIAVPYGTEENNIVLVYDYDKKAWWIWDSLDVAGWFKYEGLYDEEVLGFYSLFGNAYIFGNTKLDSLSPISSYIQTHRLSSSESEVLSVREARLYLSAQELSGLEVDIQTDDEPLGQIISATVDCTNSNDPKADGTLYADGTHYVADGERRELKKICLRRTGRFFTVKIANSVWNKSWELYKVLLGFIPWSKR